MKMEVFIVMLNKIYIKMGDVGMMVLGIGMCVLKNVVCIEVYGMVDEINLVIGIVCFYLDGFFDKVLLCI